MPNDFENTMMPVDNSSELEAIIAQNEQRKDSIDTTNDILEASLMQNEKNTEEMKETIKKSGSSVAEAVKELKPEMQKMGKAANFVLGFLDEIKGDKGDDGYTPKKGQDYYTKEEIASVVKEIQDSIRIPEDGKTPIRGEDYFTDEDISSMVEDVFSRIPTPKDGKDAEIDYEVVVSECLSRIPKIKAGKNGKDGKDGTEITSEQILDKIRGLLSYNDLKDLPTMWKNVSARDYDLIELKDVSITSPTNGQVLKYNSTTRKWENATDAGGAGHTIQDEGVDLTQRTNLNFVGANVTVTDDAGNDATVVTIGGGGGTPGGADTQVQFNDGGAFGGDAGLTFNKTTDTLAVGGGLVVDTSTLVVDSTNNRVGIGTATPLSQFHSQTGSNTFNFVASRGSTTANDFAAIGFRVTTSTADPIASIKGGIFFERTDTNGRGLLHLSNNGVDSTENASLATARLTIDYNGLIGLGTTAPTHTLTLPSTSTGIALYNTADQVTNYERFLVNWSSNILVIGTEKGGTGSNRSIRLRTPSRVFDVVDSPGASGVYQMLFSTANNTYTGLGITGSGSGSSGIASAVRIFPTHAQSGTAGYNALWIDITETSTGSGVKRLISAQVGRVDKFVVDNAGNTTIAGNIIATKQIYYAAEIDNGNSGASDTIDWTLGNIQKSTITADCTYTFTAPTGPGHYTLRIIQDATGSFTATLPAGKWTSGIIPVIKDTLNKWTIVNIYYDGTAYSYSINANLS